MCSRSGIQNEQYGEIDDPGDPNGLVPGVLFAACERAVGAPLFAASHLFLSGKVRDEDLACGTKGRESRCIEVSVSIRSALTRGWGRALFALSRGEVCHGIEVRYWMPEPEHLTTLDKVCRALKLIGEFAPSHMARIRRDFYGIWIRPIVGMAELDPHSGLCCLDPDTLLQENISAEQVAASIVHEATHARLLRLGIGYEEARRARVEDLCFRAEARFARSLPGSEKIVEMIEGKRRTEASYWTNEAFRHRFASKLEEIGLPKWVSKVYLRFWANR